MARRGHGPGTTRRSAVDDGLNLQADLSGVIDFLASGNALTSAVQDPEYLDAIGDQAYSDADHQFNIEAVTAGKAGLIPHMFEWGTVGINNAKTNMRPNGLSPAARLWETFTDGTGIDRDVWFTYKPSMAYVPKPTRRETGMDPEIIANMKPAKFRWKAEVMEEGQEVTIRPRKGHFLLIPARKANKRWMSDYDRARGFTITRKEVTVQHTQYYGNFTTFWLKFWETTGGEILDKSLERQIKKDFTPIITKKRSPKKPRNVNTINITAEMKAAEKTHLKTAKTKANTRKVHDE
jgi:hypothetical protein